MMICYYTVKHYMRHNDESKLHLLPLIQNVPSTVFFMLRRGSNQWICVLHGTMLVKKLWEKRFIHLIPLKQILMMPKNAQTEICHVFFTPFAMMGQCWWWETMDGAKCKSCRKKMIYNFHHALPGLLPPLSDQVNGGIEWRLFCSWFRRWWG